MKSQQIRCVIVASTSGSVMNELLKNDFFKSRIFSIISDRQCQAIVKAQKHGIRTEIFRESDVNEFCNNLMNYLDHHGIDYVISFFTKLFIGEVLEKYKDRIINLHPSLLPSFKGMDGFGDAVRYGVRFVGSTIHFIDEKMDEGKIILQTSLPIDNTGNLRFYRHRIFLQQCQSLLQVIKWLDENRIIVDGSNVIIKDAKFSEFEFSPNLDFPDAKELSTKYKNGD
jgi:phosphoribosylglycinamide formyltransferase-1